MLARARHWPQRTWLALGHGRPDWRRLHLCCGLSSHTIRAVNAFLCAGPNMELSHRALYTRRVCRSAEQKPTFLGDANEVDDGRESRNVCHTIHEATVGRPCWTETQSYLGTLWLALAKSRRTIRSTDPASCMVSTPYLQPTSDGKGSEDNIGDCLLESPQIERFLEHSVTYSQARTSLEGAHAVYSKSWESPRTSSTRPIFKGLGSIGSINARSHAEV